MHRCTWPRTLGWITTSRTYMHTYMHAQVHLASDPRLDHHQPLRFVSTNSNNGWAALLAAAYLHRTHHTGEWRHMYMYMYVYDAHHTGEWRWPLVYLAARHIHTYTYTYGAGR